MKKLLLSIAFLMLIFVTHSQMVTSGSAFAQSCDCYTITPDANVQAGGVWSPNTIDLNNPFDFSFQVYLGADDVWGADGIVFVLQQGQTNPNNVAQNLGYSTIAPSVGVEIDTWQNSGAPFNDPAADHITIMSNGDFSSVLTPSVDIPNVEDGAFHTFQVVWDPVLQVLAITLDGNFISAFNGDIINTIFGGNPNVYFGFTGATGGVNNLQQLCMYRTAAFTPTATTACIGQSITFNETSTSDLNQITNYSWDFGDGIGTSTLQNPSYSYTASGTYTASLTITDITGCTNTSTVSITVSPALSITVTPTNVSCNGANDGSLLATPTTGVAPYLYAWDIPSASQNPTGLSPNTYNLTVTDNQGCTGTATETITEPALLTVDNVVGTDASCGLNNGTLTVTELGGTSAYQYGINGGALQGSNVFNGLASGNYTVQIQDANGCTASGNGIVGQASLMAIDNIVVTDVTCGGVPDGTITVNVINGNPAYTYSLNGGAGQASNVFSGLSPATYTIDVTDANNCVVSDNNVVVNSATAMTIDNIIPTDATCNGLADGGIEVLVTGGAPVVQYSIDAGANFQTASTFNSLGANAYSIQVQDGNGCILNGNTTINEPTPLSIDNISVDSDVLCNGGNDGQITIIASGGNGNYTYSLDGGTNSQVSNVFSNITAGNYTVTLLEGANCTTSINGDFLISEPAPLSIDNILVTDVTCNGLTDGAITVTASGGTLNLVYSIDGGATQNTTSFTNLGIGTYTLELTDANNCPMVTQDFTIIESAPLTVALGNDTTLCDGTTGDLCAIVSGGSAPFQYYWNGITTVSGPACLTTNVAGNYTVDVTDVNGCTSINTGTQNVSLFPPLAAQADLVPDICLGDNATIFGSASGGNGGPYVYTWVANVDGAVLNGQSQTVSPSQNTTYSLTVSDGCTVQNATATTSVSLFVIPNIVIEATPQVGCTPLVVDVSTTVDVNLLSSQNWDFGNGETATTSASTQTFVDEGCYTITYNMTTSDGCYVDTVLTDFVCVYPYPVANFEFTPENPDLLQLDVDFLNQSTGGASYLWEFGTGATSSETSPTYVYPEYGAVDYNVELTVTNDFGCTDSIIQIVHVTELPYYYIPNSFTPEDNGLNETFQPIFIPGFIPFGYTFRIVDRWGELVFQTNDIYSSWDGTFNGKLVEDGVYVWQIIFRENETDKRFQQFGHVTVLY